VSEERLDQEHHRGQVDRDFDRVEPVALKISPREQRRDQSLGGWEQPGDRDDRAEHDGRVSRATLAERRQK
jgi:hypothetical protein